MAKYLRASTVKCEISVTDVNGAIDPTTMPLVIYDPLGVANTTKVIGDLTKTALGVYYYNFAVPADATYGDWRYEFVPTNASGEGTVVTTYFYVDETDTSLWCSFMDVYRRAGISNSVISEGDVADAIRDSMAEVEELHGKSYNNTQSKTEWFDTLNDDVESIESNPIDTLFLAFRPVQSITSVAEYDTSNNLVKTWTSDEYWIDLDMGILSLIDNTFVNQRHRVKVVYTYGYITPPRKITKLVSIISAMSILIQQMGGTYDDVTSYSLPTGVSIGVGEPYMNMRTAIGELEKELKRTIDTIGLQKDNSVVI